jgi:predicted SprT family Zn-dependent metalloprotease
LEEIGNLYRQHTVATGQVFEDSAVERALYWTEGQPWLVNALAYDVVSRQFGDDYSKVISGIDIDQAAKTLILRNDTHLDSLLERLREPRIRRVMEAVITGIDSFPSEISDDDAKYTLDLGLLKKNLNKDDYQPANPIYQEVIVRAMSSGLQKSFPAEYVQQASEFMNDNNLNMTGLLKTFQVYWRENSEMQTKKYENDSLLSKSIDQALQKYDITLNIVGREKLVYDVQKSLISLSNEALTHLVLYAFLQRVLNGGADFIQMEYALGRLRADICVGYKKKSYPVELKIKGAKPLEENLEQLSGYMDRCGTSEGWLVIFDKSVVRSWDEKIYWETKTYKDKTIHLVGC